MYSKVLLLLALVASALGSPARVKNDQCPLRTLKDAATCRDQHSECWSPGEGDVDCPNNGLCCFDGCVNKCKIPGKEEIYEQPPKCRIDYEQKEELVKMDHCVDVPDLQTCVESQKLKCRQHCEMFEEPYYVENVEKCCKTEQQLVCEDAPCNENELYELERPVEQEVCLNQQEFCWKRPDQQCFDVQVPDCKMETREECRTTTIPKKVPKIVKKKQCRPKDVQKCNPVKIPKRVQTGTEPECTPETKTECKTEKKTIQKEVCNKVPYQKCDLVKKPIETKIPDEKCSTKFREECENKVKQWCPDTREGRAGIGCQEMTYKDCKKVPYEHCQHFTRTEITYVDENVCKTLEETKCEMKPFEEEFQKCFPITIQNCVDRPVYGTVYEERQECHTVQEQECFLIDETIYETKLEEKKECYPVTEEKCSTKTEKQCKMTDKEECLERSQECDARRFPEVQKVKKNCKVKEQLCRLEPKETCQEKKIPAELRKPVKKCRDVCEPYTTNECDPAKTRKECKKITKKMYFKVPVEKCEKAH